MKTDVYERLLRLQTARRSVLKGTAGIGAAAALGALGSLADARAGAGRSARANSADPGRRQGLADRRRLAEGRRAVPRADQGQRQGRRVRGRRADLHGAQQPEPAQLPVPRLPQAVGGVHRRQDHLDRPRPGRLQPAPAAVDRDRHGRLRHHRDGRPVRGRRLRQGPRLGDAGLGQGPDRDGRLCRLPAGAGRHLGRQDLPHLDRRRLPQLQLPHRRLRRCGSRRGLEGRGRRGRMGRAEDLAAGPGGDQVPQGQAGRRPGRLRLSRPAQGLGRLRLLLPRQPRHRLCQAPGRQGLAVRRRHDEAARQQPGLGARDPGRDRRARRSSRPTRSTPTRTPPASSSSWPAPARCCPGGATSARTPRPATPRSSATSSASTSCRARTTSTTHRPASGTRCRAARTMRRTWPISAGASTSWRGSTAIRSSRRRPGAPRRISAARTSRSGARPIRPASSPTATATSTSRNGSAPATTRRSSRLPRLRANSYNHPNAAIEPRIPGIFQYYSVAEDELAKIYAGKFDAQTGADNIAAAWEKITDQIGREKQIALYKASLGV